MLAANIGAGATVNAAGLGLSRRPERVVVERLGGPGVVRASPSGWGRGSGRWPRRTASTRPATSSSIATVRPCAASSRCWSRFGCLWILAAQLIAGAAILNVLTGAPRWLGSLIGGGIMTVYFAAGGLLGTAWVNTLQLIVMLAGLRVALPFALEQRRRPGGASRRSSLPAGFTDLTYSAGPGSGWTFLALTGPAFVISPGLIQKSCGAASARALQIGVGLNAVGLLLFAFVPVLLGMAGRVALPPQASPDLVLPAVLQLLLPTWLGALALAAVFSTEVDTSDAILFMISTSMSKDIYKRHLKPQASDAELLLRGAHRGGGGRRAGRRPVDLPGRDRPGDDGLLLAARRQPVRAGARRLVSRAGPGRPEALGAIAAGVLHAARGTLLGLPAATPGSTRRWPGS